MVLHTLGIIICLMKNIMIIHIFFKNLTEKPIKPVNPPILQDSSIDKREYHILDNFKIANFNTLKLGQR